MRAVLPPRPGGQSYFIYHDLLPSGGSGCCATRFRHMVGVYARARAQCTMKQQMRIRHALFVCLNRVRSFVHVCVCNRVYIRSSCSVVRARKRTMRAYVNAYARVYDRRATHWTRFGLWKHFMGGSNHYRTASRSLWIGVPYVLLRVLCVLCVGFAMMGYAGHERCEAVSQQKNRFIIIERRCE